MKKKVSLVPPKQKKTVTKTKKPQLSAYANNDQVIIAWQYNDAITDCIGFAVYRKLNNQPEEALMNRIGFEDEEFEKGEQQPSTKWPIQRFLWTDFSVSDGDSVSYRIVPILFDGDSLSEDNGNASDWTNILAIKTGVNAKGDPSPYSSYFNRGIISSQFFSRMKEALADELPGQTIKKIIDGENNKLRDFLGGFLDNRLFGLLDEVIANPDLTIHGALYELHQRDLITKLSSIADRAHIILANGAAKKKGEDKNADSREEIRNAGVEVFDRIVDVTQKHFAHNKFLVISEKDVPKKVWTGSTNWTTGGMFSQVNNGVIIDDRKAAKIYLNEWKALKDDVENSDSGYGPELYAKNKSAFRFGSGNTRVWFAPTEDFRDLEDVESLMENAKKGILFLMFNPGPRNTFFNYIQDLQTRKPDLFIHGVINQDPGATSHNPLIFFHRGQKIETDWNAIIPKAIGDQFKFWYEEVSAGMVTIHSKVLVIDPFSDEPFVVTGSHNFGPKASSTNDENLLIINDKRVAEEFAVNIMAVYDHYRWRYSLFNQNTDFNGLTKDREWMSDYMTSVTRMKELKFWM